jgi:dienelactone hydrolase
MTAHQLRRRNSFGHNDLDGFVTRLFLVAVLSATCAACAPALTDLKPSLSATDSGTIWFATPGSLLVAPDGSRLIAGDPVALSAELTLPSGAGPWPAVVLAHGCSGVVNTEKSWAQVLHGWGYATLMLDSFRARGLTEVCTNPRALIATQRVPDAYGALRILATHPRIDRRRIGLMGFSHGAILTMIASTEWARERYAVPDQPTFRAFFAFYPSCDAAYPEREHITAPLRIHSGELDDWTPAAPCEALVELLRRSGQDAAITVYPGAHHSFDNVGLPFQYLPDVDNGAGCALTVASVLGPGPPASELARCLRKGATVAWSPGAEAQARRNLLSQLTELLK